MKFISALTAASLAFMLGTGAALAATTPTAANHYNSNPAEARRATQALNLLEAKGYGDFKDFKRDGQNFQATVQRHGKTLTVMVNPDAKTVQPTT